ncbi:hypothetical protein ACHQM5_001990 [Ranunculus cassubicifolius]
MGASKYGFLCDSIAMGVNSNEVQHNSWGAITMNGNEDSDSTMSSSFDSRSSSSSLDLVDDASSSSSSESSPSSSSQELNNNGPLYELSELMAQLPIKRGLSVHFQGKSQSFTSLANVSSIEDLAKRENPYRKNMKSCKSYSGSAKSFTPKTCSKIISKKAARGSFLSSLGKRNSPNNSPRSPFSFVKNF